MQSYTLEADELFLLWLPEAMDEAVNSEIYALRFESRTVRAVSTQDVISLELE